MKLFAVILTKNEARHISDCLASVAWADQVVVSDSFSDDGTPDLARAAGALVIERTFNGWAGQRNAALDTAAQLGADWVLFVDADERATPELAVEIRSAIETGTEVGWSIPRYNYIVGKQPRHGGFYPDFQLRLLRIGRGRYDLSRPVHEVVTLEGTEGRLRHHLVHFNYDTWAQFHAKQRHYGAMEARILKERGISPRPHNFILQPWREFRRRYLTLQGYKDGWLGLKLSVLLAYYYGFYPYWVLLRKDPYPVTRNP